MTDFSQAFHINPQNIYGIFGAGLKISPIYMEIPYIYMIELSMVDTAGPHFRAETDRVIVPVLERFQAFPTLKNLTRETSYTPQGLVKKTQVNI